MGVIELSYSGLPFEKTVPTPTFALPSYLVLEANDRVGGRTLSIKVKGPKDEDDALDLGAHWVCTKQPHVMELIEKYGIGYYPQNTTGTKIMQVIHSYLRLE